MDRIDIKLCAALLQCDNVAEKCWNGQSVAVTNILLTNISYTVPTCYIVKNSDFDERMVTEYFFY